MKSKLSKSKEIFDELEQCEILNPSDLNHKNIKRKATKRKIMKDLLVFSISFFLCFSSANGISNLQSSINGRLGVLSLSVSSAAFLIVCLILPSILNKYFNYKWPLIGAQFFVALFTAANLYPRYWTLLPISFLTGASNSILWTFQGSFISQLANEYGKVSTEKVEVILMRFFGIFLIVFQLNQITGNIISSLVFNGGQFFTSSNSINITESILFQKPNDTLKLTCGSNDCPILQLEESSAINRPDNFLVNLLCLIYLGIAVIGILALAIFLDDIKAPESNQTLVQTVASTFKMFSYLKTWLLLPLMAFIAFFNVFLVVDFSKSYIGCAFGLDKIGIWFGLWGLASSLFSSLIGYITKHIKKYICLLFAYVLALSFLILLYYDTDSSYNIYIYYGLAIILGMLETTWNMIMNTIIGIAFKENQQAAFANNRFCISLFFVVPLFYSSFLCVKYKILILIAINSLTFISTILFEIKIYHESKKDNIK